MCLYHSCDWYGYGYTTKVCSPFLHCCWSSERGYINPRSVFNLLRQRTSINLIKQNGFKLEKKKKRKETDDILKTTMTDADYTNDVELLENTFTQAEYLFHSLEQAAEDNGRHMNAEKRDYMCFNQNRAISTQISGPLKLVNKFTYLGSSVSSAVSNVNMCLAKAWTTIDRISII